MTTTTKTPIPVYYIDKTNYTEVAWLLQELARRSLTGELAAPMAEEDAINIQELADHLEKEFIPDALQELLETEFGKGMLLGFFLENKKAQAEAAELQVLAEMDEEDSET